jgi:hypothetical protein
MGNPMTGEAYLLLDQPKNPPPAMELGFNPNLPYVPSVPSPFGMLENRLPALLEQADMTLQTLRGIVAACPIASTGAIDSSPTLTASCTRVNYRR